MSRRPAGAQPSLAFTPEQRLQRLADEAVQVAHELLAQAVEEARQALASQPAPAPQPDPEMAQAILQMTLATRAAGFGHATYGAVSGLTGSAADVLHAKFLASLAQPENPSDQEQP